MDDKDIPMDNGVGVERHDHVLMPSSNVKDHLEGTATPLVWNASCVSCSKSKRKCDGLRPCSEIREGMVRMMMASPEFQQALFPDKNEGTLCTSLGDAAPQEKPRWDEGQGLASLSVCVFWSAVALGALATGWPTESVKKYVRSAKDAMRRCEGFPNADLARAWTLLGQVDGFSGDMEGFQRCLRRAETLIRECKWSGKSEDVPLELMEAVEKREIVNLYGEYNMAAVGSFCRREIAPVPRMGVLSSDGEVYVVAIRIKKMVDKAIFVSHGGDSRRGITGLGGVDESEARATKARGSTIGESLYLSRLNSVAKQLWSILSAAELLEVVAQRMLAVAKATKGEYDGALRHIRSAVDVFSRYPGVIRFSTGFHCSHYLASFLAVLDDSEARELYGRVRAVSNSMRSPSFSPIPPLEEWKGVHTCCQHIICRRGSSRRRGLIMVFVKKEIIKSPDYSPTEMDEDDKTTMEDLFKLPYLGRSPTSDLVVATVENGPEVMGDGKALSGVPPTGTIPALSSAGDARHGHAPERELIVLAGADNTYGDGENGCDQGGDPMGSESLATWADPCPTGPNDVIELRQNAAGTATPPTACSVIVPEMVAGPLWAREAGRTTPLFGTYVSSHMGASKSVNGNRARDVFSMQSFDGEDPAMMIMSHQNSCQDGSSGGSDITPEDWLHVAETVLPHAKH